MLSSKIDEKIRIGWNKRRGQVSVLRERYLRDDISCHIQSCQSCKIHSVEGYVLGSDLDYYVVPDVKMLEDFYEVFEHHQIRGVILTQTGSKQLKLKLPRRTYLNFIKNMTSSSKSSVIFANEHQKDCYTQRQSDETVVHWHQRLTLYVVMWYRNHMDMNGLNHKPIILITHDAQCYASLKSSPSVKVLSLGEFLDEYHAQCSNVYQLYLSVVNLLQETVSDVNEGISTYTKHWDSARIDEAISKGQVVAGKLRVNRYHPREEAFVTPLSSTWQSDIVTHPLHNDIFISGMIDRNRGLNGDTVVVQLYSRDKWKGQSKQLPSNVNEEASHDGSCDQVIPTGRVVGILIRCNRDIVASFPEDVTITSERFERVLVIPYDSRIPKIRINTNLGSQLKHHRIVVRVDNWDVSFRYPSGHFIRSIGPIGDIETEIQAILIENELSTTAFSQLLLSELPRGDDWMIEEKEVARRKDLRMSHLIYSIDPEGCEDVDDALSVRQLKNGCMELGVHIADVSHFVKAGCHIDREAYERSTTIYLADRRYDMLPLVLSTNLCSLISDVDRYAVSVIWELSPQCEVKSVWYGRTIIRSAYKLTYEIAQDLFEDKETQKIMPFIKELQYPHFTSSDLEKKVDELRWSVKQLVNIARVIREKRDNKGALELEGVEVKIKLSNKDNIDDIIIKQPLEMHETIAECMIFANHWVAKKVIESHPNNALLRNHPQPHQNDFKDVHVCASARGYSIITSSNLTLAQSLDAATDDNHPQFNKILRMITTHAMPQAMYVSTGSVNREVLSHYGLALDLYTHFTSPIRRYADLLVHRQLLVAIGDDDVEIPKNVELQDICNHMNEKKRSAMLAQLASTSLFQSLYFLRHEMEEVDAVVYKIRTNGVMAFISRYGVQGCVYFKDRNGLIPIPSKHGGLQWTEGVLSVTDYNISIDSSEYKYTISLFDHLCVKVKVERSHDHPHRIIVELVNCLPVTNVSNLHGLSHSKQATKHIVQSVKEDIASEQVIDSTIKYPEYMQQTCTLYSLIEQMRCIGINDESL